MNHYSARATPHSAETLLVAREAAALAESQQLRQALARIDALFEALEAAFDARRLAAATTAVFSNETTPERSFDHQNVPL